MSVLVLGSINSDGVVKVPRLPLSGETIRATGFETYLGGKGANQAVAAARIGAPTSLVGRVGRDGIGADLIEELRSSGVDVGGVGGDMEATTGLALITVAADGTNTIVTVGGANHHVGSEELHAFELLLQTASVVLVQLEIPIEAVTTAVEIAHAEGVRVMLDPSPVRELPDELYGKLAWITPNELEARALTGTAVPEEAAEILRGRGVRDVVVTLGARGAYHLGSDGGSYIEAPSVTAVDTVACGDAFSGTLAARLDAGEPVPDALRWACAGGAIAATREGAFPSLPTRQEVGDLLDRRDL
jgi:ribokinase